MPVPSTISDLSTTPSSNYPAGSETPSGIDDYIRAIQAIIKTENDAQQAVNALKAAIASPAFTGNPTAPTQATSDDSTKLATTAWVRAVVSLVVPSLISTTIPTTIPTFFTDDGFDYSFGGSSNYIVLPASLGGLIIQWGFATTSGGGASISFPMTFPSSCDAVVASVNAANTNKLVSVGAITGSGFPAYVFQANTNTNSDATFDWLAIGS